VPLDMRSLHSATLFGGLWEFCGASHVTSSAPKSASVPPAIVNNRNAPSRDVIAPFKMIPATVPCPAPGTATYGSSAHCARKSSMVHSDSGTTASAGTASVAVGLPLSSLYAHGLLV